WLTVRNGPRRSWSRFHRSFVRRLLVVGLDFGCQVLAVVVDFWRRERGALVLELQFDCDVSPVVGKPGPVFAATQVQAAVAGGGERSEFTQFKRLSQRIVPAIVREQHADQFAAALF